ncbi:MAG: mechanosensitive ion channel family protein [Candidatus Gastranaerophilaceae bacterium]
MNLDFFIKNLLKITAFFHFSPCITTILNIILSIVISFLFIKIVFWLSGKLSVAFEKSKIKENDKRFKLRTNTFISIIRGLSVIVVIISLPITILSILGINFTALVTGMGFLGLAVSFGTQNLVKDVINGFFILFEDQYGVGDIIKIDSHQGYVEDMNLRTTILRDTNGNVHIIPNGEIKQVTIITKLWSNAVVDTSVNYRQNIDKIISIIQYEADKLAEEMKNIVIEPPNVKGVQDINGNSAIIRTIFKTMPSEQWKVSREFNKRIILAFNRENVEV